MTKKLEAVIFDLDGVIIDTAHYHFVAWRNLANKLGINFDEEFNEQLKGISRMESLERILVLGNKQNDFTNEEKLELATKKNDEYVALLKDMKPEDIFPGIKSFLTELKENDIKIALASASKNAPMILKALQIENFFDYIVNPDEVENGKPAPDLFLRGAEAVGAKPEFSIGVEDAIAGIEAVKSAGMFAVGVGTPEEMEKAGADWVITETTSLLLSELKKRYN